MEMDCSAARVEGRQTGCCVDSHQRGSAIAGPASLAKSSRERAGYSPPRDLVDITHPMLVTFLSPPSVPLRPRDGPRTPPTDAPRAPRSPARRPASARERGQVAHDDAGPALWLAQDRVVRLHRPARYRVRRDRPAGCGLGIDQEQRRGRERTRASHHELDEERGGGKGCRDLREGRVGRGRVYGRAE